MRVIRKNLTLIWVFIFAGMGWEYVALKSGSKYSLLSYLKKHHAFFRGWDLSTEPGRDISYFLGWAGFVIMLLTNIYILRKHVSWMQSWGKMRHWLEYHIFCGMLGPVCILFHTDFKVRGLVAISFWSMMIVAISGVLGRYFYLQALRENSLLTKDVEKWEQLIESEIKKRGTQISPENLEKMKRKVLSFVGATLGNERTPSLIAVIYKSLIGDFRLAFATLPVSAKIPRKARKAMFEYALSVRRENYLEPFKRLFGYWHALHIPFTVIMYITAIIHIAVALAFQVK